MSKLLRAFQAAVIGAALVATPALGQKTLKFIPQADLRILDPIATTAYITRNHGYMVYDTLFAIDETFQVKPQMVDKASPTPSRCATGSSSTTARRCAPPTASRRSSAGPSATRSDRSWPRRPNRGAR
jgi:hypothetical protein